MTSEAGGRGHGREGLLDAYDLLPLPIWVSTLGETSCWFNRAWLDLVSRDASAPSPFDWWQDLEMSDAVRLKKGETQRSSATLPFRVSYKLRLKDGSLRQVEEITTPRFGPAGELLGHVGVCKETSPPTDEGVASKEFGQYDAAVLNTLVNGITNHAVFLINRDGTIIVWNKGAETLIGYSVAEVIGQHYESLFSPDDRAAGLPGFILAEAAANGHFEGEGWRVRKDGSLLWAQFSVDSIRDVNGNLQGFTKVTKDITDQHKTVSLLEEARDRLIQAQKMEAVGQLTGGLAHDFNNLLTVILGSASTLQDQLITRPDLKPLADMTRLAAERGATLTKQLLAFARRQPLAPEPIDVNRSVSNMDGLLRRTLGEYVEIELIRGGGLWPAMADPSQLESAILNLCINARDAMPAGGKVTIEMANVFLDPAYSRRHVDVKPGQYVMIAISDTGTGMSPEVAARAFEPFFTTKVSGEGSGLGLSMVHGFVKQSGGHVKIYSELGQGTTIKVYLPRADGEVAESSERPNELSKFGATRILLVEDDDLVRLHVTAQLRSLGFEVESARSGREALAKFTAGEDFDLLFTDVVMPGMSGRQLADEVQKLRPNLPVLFTSGYTENAIIHHGRLDKGVHLLTKPYRREDLAIKLREILSDTGTKRAHP